MEILVINGSPKGKNSVTLHTCLYLEKKYPEHHFEYLAAGQRIKALEKDFTQALEMLEKADMLLFCYPVYTFLIPCQLHRFIELMKESGVDFSGKMATQVTTSKHFYDITAHRFSEDNCQIAANVQLISNNHDLHDRKILTCKPVHLKRNRWIGAGSSILPGVTVGENSVVGAPPR